MKQRFTLYFIILIIALPVLVKAQQAGKQDKYERPWYVVKKKTEALLDIAKKLQVDPREISALNDSMSMGSVLVKGQRIQYPLYTEMKIWEEHNPSAVNVVNENDRTEAVVEAASKQRNKKKKDEPLQTADSGDKAKETTPATTSYKSTPVDTDLIQNSILLTDATLDLNRALLQGIQASLDSLNVKDKNLIDEKNISLTIHRMQRQRDKAMLTPVLLHMQDSLKTEINREENERATLENMVSKNEPALHKADSIPATGATERDSVSVSSAANAVDAATEPVETVAADKQPAKPDDGVPPKSPALKTDNNQQKHIRPVIEASEPVDATTAVPAPIMHWETAKAIYFNDDTAAEVYPSKAGTDTAAYTPGPTSGGNEVHVGMSDSARVVKARYYYTRAMKVSNEKNYKAAADYLKKAINISPKYYDAWFALGEADAHLGLYTKALNEFNRSKALDSSNAVLYYKMGLAHLKLKQKTEALQDFNRSLKIDSDYVPAILSRAAEYAERNQFKVAIKEYSKVLKIDPSYHPAYRAKAMAEYWSKNYSGAIDDFTRFLIFNESDGAVYYYRGLAKLKEGNLMDPCTDLSVAAKLGYAAAGKALEDNCK